MDLSTFFTRKLFPILIAFFLLSLIGCESKKQLPRFKFASCAEVAPFSAKSLPTPAILKSAECGFLTVPENRTHQGGRAIKLAVVILPSATHPHPPDPIVYLAGGAGKSAWLELETLIKNGINRHRDLILMSQRGTLFAQPELMCPELDAFYVQSLSIPLGSSAYRKGHVAASQACHLRLMAQGIDLAAYNAIENAHDFADLRKALGIAQWNVLGVSDGTYVAQALMRHHPGGLRSVTLDSVVPMDDSNLIASAATHAREGFNNFFKACAEQPACAKRYPNLDALFNQLVNELELNPLKENIQFGQNTPPAQITIDGGVLVNWLIHQSSESSSTPNFANVPSWLDELNSGKAQTIAASYAQPFMNPPNLLAHGMTFGMVCSGYLAETTNADIITQARVAFPEFPNSVLAPALHFSYIQDDCRIWRIPKTPKEKRQATISAIPTLLLSGSFDAVTPPSTAKVAAQTLSTTTQITIPGVGSGVINASDCAKEIFASFIVKPDDPETSCVARSAVSVFNT